MEFCVRPATCKSKRCLPHLKDDEGSNCNWRGSTPLQGLITTNLLPTPAGTGVISLSLSQSSSHNLRVFRSNMSIGL